MPRAPRDLVLLVGNEPSLRWRTFTKVIVELAEALSTQLVVTLGALLADVPHTRPVSVTGLASDPALVARLGPEPSSYEGPTGIVGILHAACQEGGCRRRACGRRSPTTSPPRRTRKLRWRWCESSRGSSAWPSTPPSSRRAAADYERQVNLAVQSDPDVQAFVERLEQAAERGGRRPQRSAALGRDASRATCSGSCASAATSPRTRASKTQPGG